MGSASFGLQSGGDVSEMILVVRTQTGVEEFYRSDFKLGADVSMAVGSTGEAMSVRDMTADIISYARKTGVFAGLSEEGAVLSVSDASKHACYGKEVRPTDILVKQNANHPD